MAFAFTHQPRLSPYSAFALACSLLAILATGWISANIFEGLPHIEDEMAYVWQAQAVAGGHLKLASPPCPTCFLVPFVVDYNGYRFGKYPLAWPVVLSLGIRLGIRQWVNPLLAGLGVWLTYRLGQKVLGGWIGALAAFLTLTSPFFLVNSSVLLSHPWSLVLSAALTLAWLDTFCYPDRSKPFPPDLTAMVAGLCLGVQALTRPLTAVGIGLPFFIHGLYLLWRGPAVTRRRVLLVGSIALGLASLTFLIRYALTGNMAIDPYTLWWPYDRVGFGPGIGVLPGGHTPRQGLENLLWSLLVGESDLFGWARISWLFLPIGLWAVFRISRQASSAGSGRPAWLIGSLFPGLALAYMLYWIGAWIFGPRYYYESLFSLTIFTAAGIRWLMGGSLSSISTALQKKTSLIRRVSVLALIALLVSANLVYYLPGRLSGLHGLYGVEKAHLLPFLTPRAQAFTPALIIVKTHKSWIEYGTLLDLTDANLIGPYVITVNQGASKNQQVIDAFPGRTVVMYDTAEPYTFNLVRK